MVDKKPLVNDSGELKEVPTADFVDAGTGTGIDVSLLTESQMSDVLKFNFTSNNVTVSDGGGGQANININPTNGFGGCFEQAPYLDTEASQSTVKIYPYYLQLPDNRHIKNLGITTLDITVSTDRKTGVVEAVDTWYYIYITDDFETFPNFAFFDTLPPNLFGNHQSLNARYIGCVLNNASSNFYRFKKYRNIVSILENIAELRLFNLQNLGTRKYRDIKKYVPRHVRTMLFGIYDSLAYSKFYGHGCECGSINSRIAPEPIVYQLDANRNLCCENTNALSTTLYWFGFIDDINNPANIEY